MAIQLERVSQFEGTWNEDQSSEAYHADKTAVSSSALRKILKSPATFYSYVVEAMHEESDSLRFGSAFHMALLEPKKFFASYVKQPSFGDLRSAKNREARDEWKKAQLPSAVILSEENYIRLEGMLNSVLKHRDACALLKHGKAEISGYYADPETSIKCKIKPDFINFDLMTLLDVKTTQDCSSDAFSKSIWSYRYDFQLAMYAEGIRLITGRNVNYSIYLAIEKEPPFEVALYVADQKLMQKGLQDYRRALDLLSDCLHKNRWSSYQDSLETIQLPAWALGDLI